jgi:hypothetical protein
MSGPELKFCWIPRYAEPSLLVDDDDSSSDKITSSSKQNSDDFQYDESDFLVRSSQLIDRIYLKTSTYECGVPERVDQIHVLPNWGENNEEVGTSTLRSSSYGNTTITFNNETKVSSTYSKIRFILVFSRIKKITIPTINRHTLMYLTQTRAKASMVRMTQTESI